jgi:hypothetical protein
MRATAQRLEFIENHLNSLFGLVGPKLRFWPS